MKEKEFYRNKYIHIKVYNIVITQLFIQRRADRPTDRALGPARETVIRLVPLPPPPPLPLAVSLCSFFLSLSLSIHVIFKFFKNQERNIC